MSGRHDSDIDIFILQSRTLEKLSRYDLATGANGLPFVFFHANQVAKRFRSAPEDKKSRRGNVIQKADYTRELNEALRQEGTPENDALQRLCVLNGIRYDLNRTHAVVDDQTAVTPMRIWTPFRRRLEPLVAPKLLESAESSGNGGPDAEVGPTIKAAKYHLFYESWRQSIVEALAVEGRQDVRDEDRLMTQYASVVVTTLGKSKHAGQHLLEVTERQYLDLSHGLHTAFKEPLSNLTKGMVLPSSYDFLCAEMAPKTCIRAYLPEYLRSMNTLHGRVLNNIHDYLRNPGARARVVSLPARVKKAGATIPKQKFPKDGVRKQATAPAILPVVQPFTMRSHGSKYQKLRSQYIKVVPSARGYEDAAKYFPPFDATKESLRRKVGFELFKQLVSRTTLAHAMFAPFVIADDGCYTPFLEALESMHLAQMTPNGLLSGYDDGRPIVTNGVTHIATELYDVVRWTDKSLQGQEKLRLAASQVMHARKQSFRRHALGREVYEAAVVRGIECPDDLFAVAHFSSAINENAKLKTVNYEIARTTAVKHWAAITGAGERGGMVASWDGYVAGDGIHLSGISTFNLITSESVYGVIPPGAHYSALYHYIDDRRHYMVKKMDAAIISPGGVGTGEELFECLEQDKPRILVDIDMYGDGRSYWRPTIRAAWNDDMFQQLQSQRRVGNTYYAQNERQVIEHLEDIYADRKQRLSHKPPTDVTIPRL